MAEEKKEVDGKREYPLADAALDETAKRLWAEAKSRTEEKKEVDGGKEEEVQQKYLDAIAKDCLAQARDAIAFVHGPKELQLAVVLFDPVSGRTAAQGNFEMLRLQLGALAADTFLDNDPADGPEADGEPQCLGPFADAFDCPVHDPRKATKTARNAQCADCGRTHGAPHDHAQAVHEAFFHPTAPPPGQGWNMNDAELLAAHDNLVAAAQVGISAAAGEPPRRAVLVVVGDFVEGCGRIAGVAHNTTPEHAAELILLALGLDASYSRIDVEALTVKPEPKP
jgi:hypothetical protein